MALGKLVVLLGLDAAQFISGLTKADQQANKFGRNMQNTSKAADGLKNALRGLTAGVTIGAFASLIKGAIDSADRLNDLSKFTGISAVTLGGVGFAAKQAGSDLEAASKAFGKFNIAIGEANAGNKDSIASFRALGISVNDLNKLKADELLVRTAEAFASFEDGADKATLGNRVFKKSYAEIAALLDEGGANLQKNIDYFKKYSGVTEDVVRKSDAFNDELAKLGLLFSGVVRQVTAELLPVFKDIVDVLVRMKERSSEAKSGLSGIASDSSIKTWAQDLALGLAEVAEALIFVTKSVRSLGGSFQTVGADLAVLKQSFKGFTPQDMFSGKALEDMRAVLAEREKVLSEANKRYQSLIDDPADALSSSLREQFKKSNTVLGIAAAETAAAIAAAGGPPKKRPAPRIPDGSGGKDTTAQRQLDAQLKALERIIGEEQDVLQQRLHFLQGYYQTDEIGITAHFSKRNEVTADALKVTIAALDEEQRLLEKRRGSPKTDANERAALEDRIAAVIDKRSKAQRQAAFEGTKGWIEEREAAKSFLLQVEEISIALAELSNDPNATRARFDFANRALQDKLKIEAQSSNDAQRRAAEIGLRDLATTRARIGVQDDLIKGSERYSDTLDALSNAQARINIAESSGAITGLEALRQRSDATLARIGQLRAELAAIEAIVRASGKLVSRQDLRHLEDLKLQLAELEAQGDLVAKKFNDIFAGSFANSLADFVSGTKSAKDAFKDFTKSVTAQINQIASQNISEALFGKGGPASGIGDIFSGLFGGKAASKGADPAAAAASALAATTSTSTTAIASLGSATSATALALSPLDAGLGSLTLAAQSASTALLAIGKGGLNAAPSVDTSAADASLASFSKATSSAADGLTNVGVATSATDQALSAFGVGFSGLTKSVAPLITGLGGLGSSANLVTTALRSSSRDLLTDFSNAIKVDPAALSGLSAAATTTTSTLAALSGASAATDLAMAPLTTGFAGLSTSVDSVANALLSTGRSAASLFAGFQLPDIAIPDIAIDTSAFAGLNVAAQNTTSALATVANASAATELSMAPLRAGFASLNTSAGTVTQALLATGQKAGTFADFLSKTADAPEISVDTTSLLGLDRAAESTTSALAAVASSSAAADLAMTPLAVGFSGLSASADTVANVLRTTGKDAGLFADFLSKAASSPPITVDTSQLLGLNEAAAGTTSTLAALAESSGSVGSVLTPLAAGFGALNASSETAASSLLSLGASKDIFADLFKIQDIVVPSVDTSSLLGLDVAAASSSAALTSVASASAATDLAMAPLQSGFASLSTSATDFASSLVASSKDALAGLSSLPTAAPSIVVPDAGLLAFNTALTSTTAMLTTSSVSIEAAMLALSGGATSAGTSMTTMAASTVLADLAMTPLSSTLLSLTISAEAASAALLAVAGSKGAGAMGDLFSEFASSALGGLAQGGGFAHGGNPPVGRAALVGEIGPELFVPKVAGTIVPNKDLRMGGDTISNAFYFNLPPNTTSQSASQMALEVGRRVSHVMRRKN